MTEDEFCTRFAAEMMKAEGFFDGTREELAAYAAEVAPTYWSEPDQREEGPEDCARADISYWED